MNLSVSNIAFKNTDYQLYLNYLKTVGIKKLELAPYKHFNHWNLESIFNETEFHIVSTQGIFFGIDVNLFLNSNKFIEHFKKIIQINKKLGCNYTVFGSPKVRWVPENLKQNPYILFNSIFNLIKNEEVTIGLELNPEIYNCNFFNKINDLSNLRLDKTISFHYDTGCLHMAGENLYDSYIKNEKNIKNIHISEPFLASFDNTIINHIDVASMLKDRGFSGNISLEMREQELDIFKKSVDKFIQTYS